MSQLPASKLSLGSPAKLGKAKRSGRTRKKSMFSGVEDRHEFDSSLVADWARRIIFLLEFASKMVIVGLLNCGSSINASLE